MGFQCRSGRPGAGEHAGKCLSILKLSGLQQDIEDQVLVMSLYLCWVHNVHSLSHNQRLRPFRRHIWVSWEGAMAEGLRETYRRGGTEQAGEDRSQEGFRRLAVLRGCGNKRGGNRKVENFEFCSFKRNAGHNLALKAQSKNNNLHTGNTSHMQIYTWVSTCGAFFIWVKIPLIQSRYF